MIAWLALTAEGFALIGDPGQYDLFSAVTNPIDSPSEPYIGEFQARYNTPLGFLEYVELGGKYDSSKRQTVGNVTNPRNVTNQRYLRLSGADSDLALFDPNLKGADDISLIGVNAVDLPYLSVGGARTIFDENLGGLWTIFLEGDDLLRDAKDADIRSTTSSQFGDGTAVFSYPQAYQFNGGRTVTMGVRARF